MYNNRFISYRSQDLQRMKTNFVLALKNRVNKLSHPTFKDRDLIKFWDILIENSYPKHTLNKLHFDTPSNINYYPTNNNIKSVVAQEPNDS